MLNPSFDLLCYRLLGKLWLKVKRAKKQVQSVLRYVDFVGVDGVISVLVRHFRLLFELL